ncbi:MAG: hypothetical protein Q8921_15485, partial [Bacteroidota bacterium]|nr:hypothetical protein [Bacteroidota bacterium]
FTSSDQDFSLAFCTNPAPPMNVVTSAIHAYAAVPTSSPCGCPGPNCTHDIWTTTPYQDEYQIASDARYIYIVWCTHTQICVSPTSEIWATVVDRTTQLPVFGWPQYVGSGMKPTVACDVRNNRTGAIPTFSVAWIDNTPAPSIERIDYAGAWGALLVLPNTYIDPATGLTVWFDHALHARVLVSSAPFAAPTISVYAIVQVDPIVGHNALLFYRPAIAPAPVADYVDGALLPPASPIGAPRPIIDNFITAFANPYDYTDRHDGGTGPDQFHCLYQLSDNTTGKNPLVIVEGHDNGALFPAGTTDVRLVLNRTGTTLLTDPTSYVAAVNQMGIHVHWRTGDGGGTHYYARDTSRAFDEDVEENTLVTDICTVTDGSATGSNHGGTTGATILQNKTMAIWTDPNYGFSLTAVYSGLWQPRLLGSGTTMAAIDRHVGQLDFLADNISLNVGGTSELVNGSPGHLTDVPYFYFNFLGSNRGGSQGVVVHGMWDYYGLLSQHDPTTLAATLIASPFTDGNLEPDSRCTGCLVQYDVEEIGGGAIQVATFRDASFADHPGVLTLHGGANFWTGEWTSLTVAPDGSGMSGNIDVLYDGNVWPSDNSRTPTGLPDTTGIMSLHGQITLTRASQSTAYSSSADWAANWAAGGCIRGHIPYYSTVDVTNPVNANYQATGVILYVDEGWSSYDHATAPTQFDAQDFNFFNSSNMASSELRFGHKDPTDLAWGGDGGNIAFTGGVADAIEIHMIDPYPGEMRDLTRYATDTYQIENMTFNNLRGYTILAENDQYTYSTIGGYPAPGYPHITISGNHFEAFSPNQAFPHTSSGLPFPVYGIYIRSFNSEGYDGSQIGPIDIFDNHFEYNNCDQNVDVQDEPPVAIILENTTANVEGNTITDYGFAYGIFVRELVAGGPYTTMSYPFICNNTIQYLQLESEKGCGTGGFNWGGRGIVSRYGGGYLKLNTLSSNDVGYFGLFADRSFLIFNNIYDNVDYEIELWNSSRPNLTGVHGPTDDYAAYNEIYGPSSGNTVAAPFPIPIYISDGTSNIFVGKLLSGWTNWGENDLYSTSTGSYSPVIHTDATINLGNIDNNFWGYGVYPDAYTSASPCYQCVWNSGTDINAEAEIPPLHPPYYTITFSANPTGRRTAPTITSRPSVSCGTGWGGGAAVKQLPNPQSKKAPEWADTAQACNDMFWSGDYLGSEYHEWQKSYDTLKRFIETCSYNVSTPQAFRDMTSAVTHLYGPYGGVMRDPYLKWLESVLYLNTRDQEYFCADVEQIMGSLPLPNDTTPGSFSRGTNISLAVLAWLIHNTTCDTPALRQEYDWSREAQREQWANNPSAYKLDTTLPTMQQLGLDSLLAIHFKYAWVPSGGDFGKHVSSYSVSENPLHDVTTLRFDLSDAEYVRVEVFDVMGNNTPCPSLQKTGDGLFESGQHQIPIDFSRCASGTYYLRITLGTGEVRTIKLVKE